MRIGEFFLGIGAMAARTALTREIEFRILYLWLLYVISWYFVFFLIVNSFVTAVCEDSGVFVLNFKNIIIYMSERKIYIGIDPGTNGGIAVLDRDGKVLEVGKMPATPQDILDFLGEYSGQDVTAALEDVGHGIPGQSSKATATFARHNGHLEMALLALGMPTEKVTPQKWQKVYQLGSSKSCTKIQWKNKLKAKAQQLFPSLGKKITLSTSDALLIAEYARRLAL